jgi:hypothetical protein
LVGSSTTSGSGKNQTTTYSEWDTRNGGEAVSIPKSCGGWQEVIFSIPINTQSRIAKSTTIIVDVFDTGTGAVRVGYDATPMPANMWFVVSGGTLSG